MHPVENPKVHARVKEVAALLGSGAGKIVVEFDYKDGKALTYNVGVVFPRETVV